jgi:hypothetical protein
MKYKVHFLVGATLVSFQAFGQGTVTPSTNRDSNMVKQLFFAGLREKMSENYVVASTNFNKIVGLDPNNHAAYFELANANLRLDNFRKLNRT